MDNQLRSAVAHAPSFRWVAKAEQRAKFQTLTAPVDGVVQQLAVHTIGGTPTYAPCTGNF